MLHLKERDPNDYLYGSIIKRGREMHELTQERFAELANVNPRTVQRWEAGESIPWPSYVEAIAGIMPEIQIALYQAIKKIRDRSAFSTRKM